MRDLLKRAKPDHFEDLVALVALYRPGPMELIPEFVKRKQGGRVDYPDPRVEPILKPTYGIMVYQEQVMQIAQVIGGYSLGGADLLRRAMGKKLPEEMAQHRSIFVGGAAKNGVGERKASDLFDLVEKFAGYGFNRSHAAAYALVAYQTAYFKAHHTAAFIAANMSAVMNDTDKVQLFTEDARAHGIDVLPPDVNESNYRFEPAPSGASASGGKGAIRYGLGGIKGTGEAAIASMVEARRSGPFLDLFDFSHRVDKRLVNRRVVESLIRAGAFDAVDDHRARLLAAVGIALESAEQASRAANQVSLFGNLVEKPAGPVMADVPRWSTKERLQNEKLALGYYFSDHLFNIYRDEVGRFIRTRIGNLVSGGSGDYAGRSHWIAGVVIGTRVQNSANGRMGIIQLSDDTGRYEIVAFREVFEKHRHKLKDDELLVLEVRLRSARMRGGMAEGDTGQDFGVRIEAVNVMDLQEARARFARGVRLICNGASSGSRLREVLAPYRSGTCPVSVVYSSRGAVCEIDLGEGWRVNLHEDLIRSLGEWLSPENVRILYGESA
jgi:DNA polymerase III subunit alpha